VGLFSKAGLITVAAYLGVLVVSGATVQHFETGPVALPV
jgi:hypothetical protein